MRRRATHSLVLLVALAAAAPFAARGDEPTLEYQVKAAYTYNFLQFTTWPDDAFADAKSPVVIGVLGEDRFGRALDVLKDKSIGGRTIDVKRFRHASEVTSGACHALFVSSSEEQKNDRILAALRGKPILTIGETEEFASLGGVVNFIFVEDRIRFEVNPEAAARARLQISSKLLRLAVIVNDKR